jgi:hypothetical protein
MTRTMQPGSPAPVIEERETAAPTIRVRDLEAWQEAKAVEAAFPSAPAPTDADFEAILTAKAEAAAQAKAEAPALLAPVEEKYLALRAEAGVVLDTFPELLVELSAARYAYEQAWARAFKFDVAPPRVEPLNIGPFLNAVMASTGRL